MRKKKVATKKEMISDLRTEFTKVQGREKGKWVTNHLGKMKKKDVQEQYNRLHGKVSTVKNK